MLLALFVSNTGTALQMAAQAWFMWERTHNLQQLGILGLVQATPLLGLPLLGGMMADAWPRRSLLLVTQTLLAAIPALMAVLASSGALTTGLLLLMASLLSIVTAIDNPVRQVYLPGIVDKSLRGRTVALNALAYNTGAVIGPALSGLLLPLAGAAFCFLANSLSYLLVVTWLVRGPEGRPVTPTEGVDVEDRTGSESMGWARSVSSVNKGVRAAAHYLRHSPLTLVMLSLVTAVGLLGRSYVHVLPALVNANWGGEATAYGTLAALPGVGAVIAAGLTAWWLGREHGRGGYARYTSYAGPLRAGAVLLGCAIIALGLSPAFLAAGAVLIVVGFASTGTMTLLNASLQDSAPDAVRGRVLSLYTVLAAGMPALGGWALGTLMVAIAPGVALVAAGLTLVLLVGLSGLGTKGDY